MGVTNFDVVKANSFIGSQRPTQGKVFFVCPRTGNDGLNGKSPRTAFKTLAQAKAACTSGQNDTVYFFAEGNTAANTTDYQATALDWNKDLCHIIGVNSAGAIGQRSRVENLSTVAVPTPLFTLSANGCTVENMAFFHAKGSANPSAASTCVLVSGMRNHFINCQISGIGDSELDDAGSNSLTITGSENTFDDCYIGLDTIIRATSVTEVILSGTPTRTIFRRCHFRTWTSGSTFKMITIPTGADRFVLLEDCIISAAQNITSAVAPTGAIGITTMNGEVLVKNPYLSGFAQYTTADNAYVKVLGFDGTATGNLVGISQGVNAA